MARCLAISIAVVAMLVACDNSRPVTAPAFAANEAALVAAADRSLKDIDLGNAEIALKLAIVPTFETPVCVELYIGKNDSHLVVYRFDGRGGYDRGKVELVFKRQLDFYDLQVFDIYYLPKFDLWSEVEVEEPNRYSRGLDGDIFTLEVKDHTRFHTIRRWSPDAYTEERHLQLFQQLCEWMLTLGGIRPYDPYNPPE